MARLTYTWNEITRMVREGTVRYENVEPVLMPGGETWYTIVVTIPTEG